MPSEPTVEEVRELLDFIEEDVIGNAEEDGPGSQERRRW